MRWFWFRKRLRRHRHHHPPPTPVPVSSPDGGPVVITTLTEIVNGRFKTASDKHGANGVLVQVPDLKVLATKIENDGDTHITVTDGIVQIFITEITPIEKAKGLKDPPVGSIITETGYVYYDKAHATEAWHGNTGYEIHPVVAWH